MRIGYSVKLALCLVTLTFCSAMAQQITPIRLAILTGDGDRAVDDATLAQVEVALTETNEVTLLERVQIRRILAEQKLSAAGLTDPATAVKIGKLLSVEMFLFIERVPMSNPFVCRLQVIEAKTGISLAVTLADEATLSEDRERVVGPVRLAIAKKNVPDAERRFVGLLGVRSEEPGRSLDGIGQALDVLLTADLAQSPSVILLDREHLDRLRQEETLTGAWLDIKKATTLVEGAMRRAPDGKELKMTLRFVPMGGGPTRTADLTLPKEDASAMRRQVAAAILNQLHSAVGPSSGDAAGDAKREATAFANEASLRLLARDYEGAWRASETALALEPAIGRKLQLARNLAPLLENMWQQNYANLPDAGKRYWLTAALRQNSLIWEVYSDGLQRYEAGEKGVNVFPDVGLNPRFHGSPGYCFKPATGEIGTLQDELQGLEERLFQIQIGCALRAWKDKGEDACDFYWDLWHRFHFRMRYGQEGLAEVQTRLLRRVMNAVAQPPLPMSPALDYKRWNVLFALPMNFGGYDKLPEDRAAFVRFFKEWSVHPDPALRMVSYGCLIMLQEEPRLAADKLLEIFYKEFPSEHPARSELGERQFLCPLVDCAISAYGWNDATLIGEHYRKILGPYLDSGDVAGAVRWRSPAENYMNALWEDKRVAEADAVAERMLGVLKQASTRPDAASYIMQLESRRAYYARELHKTPSDAPAWSQYELRPILFKGIHCTTLSLLRDNIFCTASADTLWTIPVPVVVQAYAFPAGGKPIVEARITIPPPEQFDGFTACVNSLTWSPTHIYVGTRSGLISVPFDGGAPRLVAEKEGLLGNDVSAVAWYDEKLYVAVGGSYSGKRGIASYDPAANHWRLITSMTGVGTTGPQFSALVVQMLPDTARKCVWLLSESGQIWRFTPRDEKFECVYTSGMSIRGAYSLVQIAWLDSNLIFSGTSGLVLLDLDILKPTWIAGVYEPNIVRPGGCAGPPWFPCSGIGLWPAMIEGGNLITQRTTSVGGDLILQCKGAAPAIRHGGVYALHWTPLGILAVAGENSFLIRRKAVTAAENQNEPE